MRDPPHRRPVNLPGWNDRAAVALLVLVAGHLLAAEPAAGTGSLTPERLIRFVAAHDLPALVVACEESPSAPIRSAAAGCAASSAPVRPASMSASSPALPPPSATPSSASTSPRPPPAPASTCSRSARRGGPRWPAQGATAPRIGAPQVRPRRRSHGSSRGSAWA